MAPKKIKIPPFQIFRYGVCWCWVQHFLLKRGSGRRPFVTKGPIPGGQWAVLWLVCSQLSDIMLWKPSSMTYSTKKCNKRDVVYPNCYQSWWSLQAMKSALHSTDCASNLISAYLTLCPILLISLSCKSVILTMGTWGTMLFVLKKSLPWWKALIGFLIYFLSKKIGLF